MSLLKPCKGYWQIPMKQEDPEKNAFCTPQGLFHFHVMPFGLVNTGTSYGHMMRMVLDGQDHVVNYVDDMLVHTVTCVEHLATLRALFVWVRQAGLTIKLTKCYLVRVNFVGHQIRQCEVKTQDSQKAIMSWIGSGFYALDWLGFSWDAPFL